MMTKFTPILVATFLLAATNVNVWCVSATQLREGDATATAASSTTTSLTLQQRLDMLEKTILQNDKIITELQNRRLDGHLSTCSLEFDSGKCILTAPEEEACHRRMAEIEKPVEEPVEVEICKPADLVVKGKTYLFDGLVAEAGGCDNCIVFKDDVVFEDNIKAVDGVVFEDPVKFLNDVTIIGPEVPSSIKTSKISDLFDKVEFTMKEYSQAKIDNDETFVIKTKSRFEKNVDVKLSSSASSSASIPNLKVQGTITELGETN